MTESQELRMRLDLMTKERDRLIKTFKERTERILNNLTILQDQITELKQEIK